jgi:hypothetical protein
MLTSLELQRLVRELGDAPVLSVYVDARVTDPAMRNAWRPALTAALRAERARLTDADERAAFDRAASFVEDPWPPLAGTWAAPGWAAFLTPEGPRYAAALPVRVPTFVVWRDGPFVSPYLRALKQHRPVTVALVDSRSARLYRYALGELETLTDVSLPQVRREDAGSTQPPGLRGKARPAARGALATERVARRKRAEFDRLAASLATRLGESAGDDGWILIGGTPEWARSAATALPAHLADRTLVSATLDHDATEGEIVRAAKGAATSLRSARGDATLDALFERGSSGVRGTSGVPATQRALWARAVDLLLLTPEFVRENATLAEEVVRAGLAQRADVELLSGEAAARLHRSAGGIAARLRFGSSETAASPA